MTEELGELAHPMLKHSQGIRGITEEQMKEQVGDAFGDINVYGCQLLTQLGLDAETSVTKAVDGVLKRDWKADPVTGKTEACHKGGEHDWKEFSKGDYKYKKCAKCDVIDLRPSKEVK
jgi:NTP pyrophosphatase (non-canonical NTP hydrolase)